jgi:cytochrome c556
LRRLAENLPSLFEIRSPRTGEAGAKAAIWDEPDLFAEHVAGFQSATSLLHAAAQASDRDALTNALDATRYQCLACHFYYRRSEGRPGAEGRRGR